MGENAKRTERPGPGNAGADRVNLSIVIVTRDTRELLGRLLRSIDNDTSLDGFGTEVIVVDNASTDGTDKLVSGSFPQAAYVRNDRNLGFAASVNLGWRMARGRLVLFLNSDTVLIEEEVMKMADLAEASPDAAAIGPQLVYEDLSPQRSVAAVPGFLDEIIPRSLREKKHAAPTEAAPPHGEDVESLIGAAIMVKKDVLDELGGFDERFFFFLEETDLCVRIRQRGKRVVFFPGARVIHLQGATVRRTWVRGRMEYNISLRKFLRKHHGSAYVLAFDAVRFLKAFLFCAAAPVIVFGAKGRMRYSYYLKLLAWYLRGCPDDAGLKR